MRIKAFAMRALQLPEDLPEELQPATSVSFFEITFKDLFFSERGCLNCIFNTSFLMTRLTLNLRSCTALFERPHCCPTFRPLFSLLLLCVLLCVCWEATTLVLMSAEQINFSINFKSKMKLSRSKHWF